MVLFLETSMFPQGKWETAQVTAHRFYGSLLEMTSKENACV